MFHLACTRFNNKTYKENKEYRIKCNEIVIYGSSFKIREKYSPGAYIFVAEMNNETNKIEGIGLIKNSLVVDKCHKIYENSDYNRILYRGNYWLSRTQIDQVDPEINEIFDNILFKGKSHLKRLPGITILTEKLFTNWKYDLCLLKRMVKNVFLNYFKYNIELDTDIMKEETFEIIPKKRRKLL
jgi:hypothetical protein